MQNNALRFVYILSKRNRVSTHRTAANLMLMGAVYKTPTCCKVHKTLTLYLYERLLFREEVACVAEQNSPLPETRLGLVRRGFWLFCTALRTVSSLFLFSCTVGVLRNTCWENLDLNSWNPYEDTYVFYAQYEIQNILLHQMESLGELMGIMRRSYSGQHIKKVGTEQVMKKEEL
ncbi:hypothetical protein J6590_075120 [Homalodisca vitripennis]|nr:hypothetical protein J6590_075120 [Homalodisca vitripennis]